MSPCGMSGSPESERWSNLLAVVTWVLGRGRGSRSVSTPSPLSTRLHVTPELPHSILLLFRDFLVHLPACFSTDKATGAYPGQWHRLQGARVVGAAAVAGKCQGWNQLGAGHLSLNMRRQEKARQKTNGEGKKKKEKK